MSLDLSLNNLEINFKVGNPAENRVFEFKDFRLDAATKILYRSGKQVVLTPKAVETLIALVEDPGQVISKEGLMNKIWADTIVEESNLAQYLHILRKTLGDTDDRKTADANGDSAKRIMSEAGTFNEIIWLPDGRIAFTSNAGGSSDVWTVSADGSGLRQLTVGANARLGLALTADQKQIVFSAERNGRYNLWRIGINGSDMVRVTDGSGEYYPQCTPDGRWIVYQSGGNYPTLRKMPTDGGEPVQLTKTTASRPSLSPDGKFIAYHYLDPSFEKMRWGIGISSIEDGKRVKRFDFSPTVVERLVKWTPDGKGIAFMNSPDGVPNIWIQPLDGGPPKALTNFASDNIIAFNWNGDGKRLALIRGVETSDVLLINR